VGQMRHTTWSKYAGRSILPVWSGVMEVQKAAYSVSEVAEQLGISRESVFRLLRAGELGSILIGKRGRRVTAGQLDDYLRKLEQNT
jgi:excisionase family DNA binding protein